MNSQDGAPNASIRVSIGDLGIILDVESEDLAGRIRLFYREFTRDVEGNVLIKISSCVSKAGNLTDEPRVEIDEGVIEFDAPQLEGSINYRAGFGRLKVSSSSPEVSIDYALRIITAALAVESGGFLFHGAGIARHGSGCLFFGPSESGKTTVAKYSENDLVLNDDLVLLAMENRRWMIHATPFTNLGQIKPTSSKAPLSAMFRLVKDRKVFLEPVSPAQALAEFIANIPVLTGKLGFTDNLLLRSENLINLIPLYRLHFSLDNSFWQVVDTVISEDREQ
jgi:hypothetical protein